MVVSKVRNGYFVSTPQKVNYEVGEIRPAGVFVQHTTYRPPLQHTVELHYPGEGAGLELGMFHLPSDPRFLREIAKAIVNVADDIDASQKTL